MAKAKTLVSPALRTVLDSLVQAGYGIVERETLREIRFIVLGRKAESSCTYRNGEGTPVLEVAGEIGFHRFFLLDGLNPKTHDPMPLDPGILRKILDAVKGFSGTGRTRNPRSSLSAGFLRFFRGLGSSVSCPGFHRDGEFVYRSDGLFLVSIRDEGLDYGTPCEKSCGVVRFYQRIRDCRLKRGVRITDPDLVPSIRAMANGVLSRRRGSLGIELRPEGCRVYADAGDASGEWDLESESLGLESPARGLVRSKEILTMVRGSNGPLDVYPRVHGDVWCLRGPDFLAFLIPTGQD